MRILIVDDDPDLSDALAEALEEQYGEIASARDGSEALGLLAGGALPDVILLDMRMPRSDGFAFLVEKMKRPETARIPVVVFTADTRIPLTLDNVVAVLRKPFSLDQLQAALDLALRQGGG